MSYAYEQLDPSEPEPINRCPRCYGFVRVIWEDNQYPVRQACKKCAKASPNAAQPTAEGGTVDACASAESQLQDDQSGARQGQKDEGVEQDGGK